MDPRDVLAGQAWRPAHREKPIPTVVKMVEDVGADKTPRQPLPMTASEYLKETVYPTLEPAMEAMLKVAFPADEAAAVGEEEQLMLNKPLVWLVS